MSWIEMSDVVMAIGLLGFICYDLGVRSGKKQQKNDALARQASMRRHPSYHLRVKE